MKIWTYVCIFLYIMGLNTIYNFITDNPKHPPNDKRPHSARSKILVILFTPFVFLLFMFKNMFVYLPLYLFPHRFSHLTIHHKTFPSKIWTWENTVANNIISLCFEEANCIDCVSPCFGKVGVFFFFSFFPDSAIWR